MDGLLPFPSKEFMDVMAVVTVLVISVFVLGAAVMVLRCWRNLLLWAALLGLMAVLGNEVFYLGNDTSSLPFYLSVLFTALALAFAVAGVIKLVRKKSSG